MKVRVDQSLCQGHNRCIAMAPGLFVVDDDGYATAAGDGAVPAGQEGAAELAADNCPEMAVILDA
jgi:ferredoxin